MKILSSINQQLGNQSELIKNVPDMDKKIDTFITEISDLKKATAELTNKTAEIDLKTDKIQQENNEMKEQLAHLKAQVEQVEQNQRVSSSHPVPNNEIAILTNATNMNMRCLDRVYHYEARHEVVITGLLIDNQQVDPTPLVKAVLNAIKFEFSGNDISNCRLLIKNGPINQTIPPVDNRLNLRVSVAFTCVNHSVMNKLLTAAKATHPLKYPMLNLPLNNTNNNNNKIIYVSELLPSKIFKLLGQAKALLKPLILNLYGQKME